MHNYDEEDMVEQYLNWWKNILSPFKFLKRLFIVLGCLIFAVWVFAVFFGG